VHLRLSLLTDDAELHQTAEAVSTQIAVLRAATSKAELEDREAEFATAREALIAAARRAVD